MTIDTLEYSTLKSIPGTGSGIFSHIITKAETTDKKRWFVKEHDSPQTARLEHLAQEFFRLIIPHQPETRIARSTTNVFYILSEEITGFRNLPDDPGGFRNGTYPGLGQILITALFIQEIDLKNSNIGLTANNQVVKIDGDWSFASIRSDKYKDKNKQITPQLLSELPFAGDYYTFNWLDIVAEERPTKGSQIISRDLGQSEYFRREINQAILS